MMENGYKRRVRDKKEKMELLLRKNGSKGNMKKRRRRN